MGKYDFPSEYRSLLDPKRILKETVDCDNFKVTFNNDPVKGNGLYAKDFICAGETIAYYKIKLFNKETYESNTNFVYTFNIYGKNGKEIENLIGDLDLDSIPNHGVRNVPFWAPFVNEPMGIQDVNSEIDTYPDFNFKNGRKVGVGSVMIYRLIAKRGIIPGEEITIYYGDQYERTYEIDNEKCYF